MNLRDEWRANSRLRVGSVLVVAILVGDALLAWYDRQSLRIEEFRQTAVQVARFSSPAELALWPARSQQAHEIERQADKRLWQEVSLGQAQAEFQDWLRQQLDAVKAQDPTVRLADTDAPGDAASAPGNPGLGLARVTAQINIPNADPQIMLALLAAMARDRHLVIVDALTVRPQRLEMRVTAWFRLAPPSRGA